MNTVSLTEHQLSIIERALRDHEYCDDFSRRYFDCRFCLQDIELSRDLRAQIEGFCKAEVDWDEASESTPASADIVWLDLSGLEITVWSDSQGEDFTLSKDDFARIKRFVERYVCYRRAALS